MTSWVRSTLLGASLVAISTTAAAREPAWQFAGEFDPAPASAQSVTDQCDRLIGEIKRIEAEIVAETGPATVDTTLRRFDEISYLISALYGTSNYQHFAQTAELRDAGSACQNRTKDLSGRVLISEPIYRRLKSIDTTDADPATRQYLSRNLAWMERSGLALPEKERAKVQELKSQIGELETRFRRNISDSRKVIRARPEDLDGLPEDFIASHPVGDDGLVEISTDYTDLSPVMAFATNLDLRRRLAEANSTRAYPQNDPVLSELLDKRHEYAVLLGQPDYAAFVLEDMMLNTTEKVETFMEELYAAASPVAESDVARSMEVWRETHPDAKSLEPWNYAFANTLVKERDFGFDAKEARKYFSYDNVRNATIALAESMYDIDIRPWDIEVWHEDVEPYEVYDHGALIGRFFIDPHPRQGKFSHGAMMPLRHGLSGGRSIPTAALVMNLPDGLMDPAPVETMVHEFGHLMHHILGGHQKWAAQSGTATERDFVEAPSMIMPLWLEDYDTLTTFAMDVDGNVMPRDMFEKMRRSNYFNRAVNNLVLLSAANLSLGLHRGPAPDDLGAASRALRAEYNPIGVADFSQYQDSFGHLTGYSATVYTYNWSETLALDLFSVFEKNGLNDKATAQRYRKLILEPGGSKPAIELVRDFLGREPNLEAFKASLTPDE
ncbi:M3 family metallopeptidase [Croceicoccus sediminis]|uniref:M3 family metallopeptidase n=1 Tax=Croceicoccus sediminis TaxID=2571150 RepID=UPI00147846B7|nr:M3 family metallopeptidase [Croceicoccus sediminis]